MLPAPSSSEFEEFERLVLEGVEVGNKYGWDVKTDWNKVDNKHGFRMRVALKPEPMGNANNVCTVKCTVSS